jgi:ArsR family transcriptional regulator
MKELIKVMKALSDPNRVKIIKILQHRVMCVCEIQAVLNLAQPTNEKDGLWVNYFVADGKASPYAATLLGNLKHWLDNDLEMTRLAETLPAINREEVCSR